MMTAVDVFLREHAFVHCEVVAPSEIFNLPDNLISDTTDAQSRMCPPNMNSFVWHFWHMARSEDYGTSIVAGCTLVLDQDDWEQRLQATRRDTGSGMTKAEMINLSETVNVQEVLAYRNAVGSRTRTIASELWPDRWGAPFEIEDVRRAVDAGVINHDSLKEMEEFLTGKTRESFLFWYALNHSLIHLGQATTVKNVVKSLTESEMQE